MAVVLKKQRFWFWAGYDVLMDLSAGIFIGLLPGEKPAQNCAWTFWWSLEASWDWLPKIQIINYSYCPPPESVRWVVFNRKFVGWNWPHYFRMGFG